jgi:hypothetical protein
MPVPTTIADLFVTAASNSPPSSDGLSNGDDYLRAIQGLLRQSDTRASDVPSASTADIGAAAGRIVNITGTTTITGLGTVSAGIWRLATFAGSLTLTHNGTSLILPGGANITTAAGDTMLAESLGSGNWVVHGYWRRSGQAVIASLGTNWSIDSSGRLLNNGNTQPFMLAIDAASRNTAGTFGTYTEVSDTSSAFDASTGIFTVPVAGVYMITANGYINAGGAGGGATVYVNVNSTEASGYSTSGAMLQDDLESISICLMRDLAASDTVKISVGSFSGTGTSVVINSFSMYLLG